MNALSNIEQGAKNSNMEGALEFCGKDVVEKKALGKGGRTVG